MVAYMQFTELFLGTALIYQSSVVVLWGLQRMCKKKKVNKHLHHCILSDALSLLNVK